MGVLPALSKDFLPIAYQNLMTDPNSPIIDLYPEGSCPVILLLNSSFHYEQ